MNITAAMERACAELRDKGEFNGLDVLSATVESEAQKRADAESDGLSKEMADRYVNDYACISVHLDVYMDDHDDSPYCTTEFDWASLEKDFKEWLLGFLDGDASLLPKEIDLEGGDMEIMVPGFSLSYS